MCVAHKLTYSHKHVLPSLHSSFFLFVYLNGFDANVFLMWYFYINDQIFLWQHDFHFELAAVNWK